MTHAHPGISPLDFRIKPGDSALNGFSEDARRVYGLLYNRALAALFPPPVWEEHRRVCSIGKLHISVGWTEMLESGWVQLLGEASLPSPALPSTVDHEPSSLRKVTVGRLERTDLPLTLADMLDLMRTSNIGRPSTYAQILYQVVYNRQWYTEDLDGYITMTEDGWDVVRKLEEDKSLPTLNSDFTQEMERQLNAIEKGEMLPSELLSTLSVILGKSIVADLNWLDNIGEPFAGETADISYARRDSAPIPVPSTLASPEQPEVTLEENDPLRQIREDFIGTLIIVSGRTWWMKTNEERSAIAVYVVMNKIFPLDDETFDRRVKYDALIRWMLGVTTTPTPATLRLAKRWWDTLDTNKQHRIVVVAENLIEALRLTRPKN